MSWLLFIDESGQDRHESPYEVLAGVAVEDRQLWSLITQLNDLQAHYFGVRRFREFQEEAKAKRLLKRKTFRLAAQCDPLPHDERTRLAHAALEDGANVSGFQLAALGQAKIAYCEHMMRICRAFHCAAFASIVPNTLPRHDGDFLRKDYAFLFERFFHFLNNRQNREMGIVVFDELEKSQSHILIEQMERYFTRTRNGRTRSRLVIPEPLFVHSDLTSMIQVADIVAYVISWGVRLPHMTAPAREELGPLAREVLRLRYLHETPGGEKTWGFKVIRTLEAAFDG